MVNVGDRRCVGSIRPRLAPVLTRGQISFQSLHSSNVYCATHQCLHQLRHSVRHTESNRGQCFQFCTRLGPGILSLALPDPACTTISPPRLRQHMRGSKIAAKSKHIPTELRLWICTRNWWPLDHLIYRYGLLMGVSHVDIWSPPVTLRPHTERGTVVVLFHRDV